MGALQHLPVVAVAGAVMQLALVTDGSPVRLAGGQQNGTGGVDLALIRGKGPQDRTDLRRVDAPHAGVAKFLRRLAGCALQRGGIGQLGHDAV